MYYEKDEKKYYRFPSMTSLLDFEEYNPQYFPTQNQAPNQDSIDVTDVVKLNNQN